MTDEKPIIGVEQVNEVMDGLNALIAPLIEAARDEGIVGDATTLFEEIARESDDKLTPDAQRLKRAMNAVVAKLLESAVASAQAEMRERCARESEEPIFHEASCPIHNGGDNCDCAVGDLTDAIRALPLPEPDDTWLRRLYALGVKEGQHWPERAVRSYESILAEAVKEPR